MVNAGKGEGREGSWFCELGEGVGRCSVWRVKDVTASWFSPSDSGLLDRKAKTGYHFVCPLAAYKGAPLLLCSCSCTPYFGTLGTLACGKEAPGINDVIRLGCNQSLLQVILAISSLGLVTGFWRRNTAHRCYIIAVAGQGAVS